MKRKKNNYNSLFNDFKSLVKIALWIVLVIMLIIIFSRYILNSYSDTPRHEIVTDGLTEVILPEHLDNVTLNYSAFTAYFNPTTHVPNCVAYEILASETDGEEPRRSSFDADHRVDGCPESADYRNSGYDRGHMAPAADMKWSETAMDESFLMTNICPQARSLNSGIWNKLEKRVRQWAVRDSNIIVVCGPIFDREKPIEYIGDVKVAVPHRFFKALYAPRNNIGIAFIFNNEKVKGELRRYAVTIDSVESITGMDLFHTLPDDIETSIEQQCNYTLWEKR